MADSGKNAITTTDGDGSTKTFPVGFLYLDKADVTVTVDSGAGPVTQSRPSNYDFDAAGTSIVFVVAPPATPASNVVFKRVTPNANPAVTFSDSSPVTAANLDRVARQSLYYTQEVEDKT